MSLARTFAQTPAPEEAEIPSAPAAPASHEGSSPSSRYSTSPSPHMTSGAKDSSSTTVPAGASISSGAVGAQRARDVKLPEHLIPS